MQDIYSVETRGASAKHSAVIYYTSDASTDLHWGHRSQILGHQEVSLHDCNCVLMSRAAWADAEV